MSSRPLVTVQKENKVVRLPKVFLSPIRYDVVQFVHRLMNLNSRQPYALSRRAGHQTSAESWGTGRAVARIPRVSGGGTHRSGQGAFGNMCRGGHRFGQPKQWRRWNKPCNRKIRKLAVRSALAASAVPALVLARGHRIAKVPEIPLVVSNLFERISHTKAALRFLASVGLRSDCQKVKADRTVRAGKGKVRGRRHKLKKGPLVICNNMRNLHLALRNLPGVELMHVKHLNLLRLAPGGHVGRMIVWTENAFKRLNWKFRSFKPGHVVDGKRVINSEEVQGAIRKKKREPRKKPANRRQTLLHILNPGAKVWAKIEKGIRRQKARIRSDPRLAALERYRRDIRRNRFKAKVTGLMTKKNKPVPGKEDELKRRFAKALMPMEPRWSWDKIRKTTKEEKRAKVKENIKARRVAHQKRKAEVMAKIREELKQKRTEKLQKQKELKAKGEWPPSKEALQKQRAEKAKARKEKIQAGRKLHLEKAKKKKEEAQKRKEKRAKKREAAKAKEGGKEKK